MLCDQPAFFWQFLDRYWVIIRMLGNNTRSSVNLIVPLFRCSLRSIVGDDDPMIAMAHGYVCNVLL